MRFREVNLSKVSELVNDKVKAQTQVHRILYLKSKLEFRAGGNLLVHATPWIWNMVG